MKRAFLSVILSLLLLFMSAATAASAATKKDTKAPAVTKSNPAAYDADVMVDGDIQIRFSEAVKKGSKISKISLKESDIKTVAFSYEIKDKFLIIRPKAKLKYDTVYTVTIPSGAVQDKSGNKLANNYSFNFITEEDPASKKEDDSKAYKYLVELEISLNEKLDENMAQYYTQLLKQLGFDAAFRSIKEMTPAPKQ